jgi:hypothetical protein
MVHLAQIMHLSCTYTNTVSQWKEEILDDKRHVGVPSGASKMIFEHMVHSTQTMHLFCTKISTISKQIELSFEPRQLGVPSGASKTIFEPTVRLAQTVHLSCTDTNTISKQKEVRFHMTHVTYEFPSGASNMISRHVVRLT